MTTRFRALATHAGHPQVRLHDMRHAYASLLLRSGMDAVQVAALLGHSTPYTTLKVYATALPKPDLAAAIEAALPIFAVAAGGSGGVVASTGVEADPYLTERALEANEGAAIDEFGNLYTVEFEGEGMDPADLRAILDSPLGRSITNA